MIHDIKFENTNEIDDIVSQDLVIQLTYKGIQPEYSIYYYEGKYIESFATLGEAITRVVGLIDETQFFPNVFYENERGNRAQLILKWKKDGKEVAF